MNILISAYTTLYRTLVLLWFQKGDLLGIVCGKLSLYSMRSIGNYQWVDLSSGRKQGPLL